MESGYQVLNSVDSKSAHKRELEPMNAELTQRNQIIGELTVANSVLKSVSSYHPR